MNIDTLQGIGLTANEAKTYLSVLELGASSAGKIAQKTGIHRRNIYDILERLISKGFISYIKQNTIKVYKAADPTSLVDLAEQRKRQLEKMLPELSLLYSSQKETEETLFYKGKDGVKAIFEMQITEGKEVLVLGASKDAQNTLAYFLEHYTNKRKEKKIRLKLIYFGGKKGSKVPNSESRYLPEQYGGASSINIWGNKTAIIQWSQRPLAILVNNKSITDSFRKQFDLMWSIAKQ